MKDHRVEALRSYLDSTENVHGEVDVTDTLKRLLSKCWESFDGSDTAKMAHYKLERLDNPSWSPPILSFEVERHGGIVKGSIYAAVQGWNVNLDTLQAEHHQNRKRRLYPAQPKLNVQSLAREIAGLIIQGIEDPRVEHLPKGQRRILMKHIIPTAGPKQTQEGRRKRFNKALLEYLEEAGWKKVGPATYQPDRK